MTDPEYLPLEDVLAVLQREAWVRGEMAMGESVAATPTTPQGAQINASRP